MLISLLKPYILSLRHKRDGLVNSELLTPLLGVGVVLITFFVSGLVVLVLPDYRFVFLIALMLLPVAAIGHVLGLKMHDRIMRNDQQFKRVIGGTLLLVCTLGLWKTMV